MTGAGLLVRVRNVAGGLERVVAMVRRRALPVRRLSVAVAGDDTLELLCRVDPAPAAVARVRAELLNLYDVLAADELADGTRRDTRELVLVRVGAESAKIAAGAWRRVAEDGGSTVLEITGAPAEVDAALARLQEQHVLTALVRSGEIALPAERTH